MEFTREHFQEYFGTQFKTDFDRYFIVEEQGGMQVITGVKHEARSVLHPTDSIENDWYFAGVYTFMLLAQMSILKRAHGSAMMIEHSGYPFLYDPRQFPDGNFKRILEERYQDAGGPNHHKYYFDMLNVVVPTLMPELEKFLDAETDVYQKAKVLETFSEKLNQLIADIQI